MHCKFLFFLIYLFLIKAPTSYILINFKNTYFFRDSKIEINSFNI